MCSIFGPADSCSFLNLKNPLPFFLSFSFLVLFVLLISSSSSLTFEICTVTHSSFQGSLSWRCFDEPPRICTTTTRKSSFFSLFQVACSMQRDHSLPFSPFALALTHSKNFTRTGRTSWLGCLHSLDELLHLPLPLLATLPPHCQQHNSTMWPNTTTTNTPSSSSIALREGHSPLLLLLPDSSSLFPTRQAIFLGFLFLVFQDSPLPFWLSFVCPQVPFRPQPNASSVNPTQQHQPQFQQPLTVPQAAPLPFSTATVKGGRPPKQGASDAGPGECVFFFFVSSSCHFLVTLLLLLAQEAKTAFQTGNGRRDCCMDCCPEKELAHCKKC